MWKEEKLEPWVWDIDYPEEMYGIWYPEDVNAIVSIDSLVDIHQENERKKQQ